MTILEMTPLLQEMKKTQWDSFMLRLKDKHDDGLEEFLSMEILSSTAISDEEEARKALVLLYSAEVKFHKTKQEAHRCLKQTVGGKLSEEVFEKVYPGFVQKYVPNYVRKNMKAGNERLGQTKIGSLAKIVISVISLYIDPYKDISLLASLIGLVGMSAVVTPRYFSYFPIQIIWILAASIILPLFSSAVKLALSNPLAIFGYKLKSARIPRAQLMILQIFIILIFPFIPALLALSRAKDEEMLNILAKKLQQEKSENKDNKQTIKKILEIRKFLKMTKNSILNIRITEVVENGLQLTIQGMMLLLLITSTKTTSGLERAFDSSDENTSGSEELIYLSIILSFRTMISTCLKVS